MNSPSNLSSHPKKHSHADIGEIPGEIASEIADVLKSHAKGFETEMRAHYSEATRFVRENPVVSAIGALALGYLIGRIAAPSRVVYIEKSK